MCAFANKSYGKPCGWLAQPDVVQEGQVDIACTPDGTAPTLSARVTHRHADIRYLSVLPAAAHGFNVLAQLRHTVSGEPLCSALANVDLNEVAHSDDSDQLDVFMHCLKQPATWYHTLGLAGALKGFCGNWSASFCTTNVPHG